MNPWSGQDHGDRVHKTTVLRSRGRKTGCNLTQDFSDYQVRFRQGAGEGIDGLSKHPQDHHGYMQQQRIFLEKVSPIPQTFRVVSTIRRYGQLLRRSTGTTVVVKAYAEQNFLQVSYSDDRSGEAVGYFSKPLIE